MKEQTKREFYWRKLDDQAKVFALASNNKYSSIFRLSVVLKEEIEQEVLQKALELALDKYRAFKVKMKRGLFWYYFEENDKNPIISRECEYPFKRVNTKENNDYLFKVTYFKKKINIEFFHALTDGNGGSEFFKEIVYRYLQLKHSDKFNEDKIKEQDILQDSENAYKKSYIRNSEKSSKSKKAYMIKGEKLKRGQVGINHFNISLEEIKKHTKENECSLSMYLISMIVYSIYETNYRINNGKRPINICVPINLKKYVESDTLSNFLSYMVVTLNLNDGKEHLFEDILESVKKEFEKKMKIEKILGTISADAGKTNNVFIRVIPLVIKKIAVRLGSLEVKRHFTMTVSNMGRLDVDEIYKEYIENFLVILAPDWAEKIKCGICSYENNLVVTFGTLLKENSIERKFRDLLKEKNIKFKIEGNGVNVISY